MVKSRKPFSEQFVERAFIGARYRRSMERAATKAEEYQREAERADRLAEEATSGEADRQFYLLLAKRWRKMAAVAERLKT